MLQSESVVEVVSEVASVSEVSEESEWEDVVSEVVSEVTW